MARGFVQGAFTIAIFVMLAVSIRSQTTALGPFAHIALMVPNVEEAAKDYADVYGVDVPRIDVIRPPFPANYAGDPKAGIKRAMIKVENLQIDLLEPIGGASPWRDTLDKRGVGAINHVAFSMRGEERQRAVVDRLVKRGGQVILGEPGGSFVYVYLPKLGYSFELDR